MIRTFLSLPGWLVLWIVLSLPLHGLEVRQTFWGFDGRLVPGQFNPVSILVDNPTPSTFEGQVTLTQSDGGMRGTDHSQAVYLAPRTTRWVQFHVFVSNHPGSYRVRWGSGGAAKGYDVLEDLKLGPPACVWLRDSTNVFASSAALKAFPDELFPTTVSATAGLDAVVLDHVPLWEPARRQAFLDWVRLGGTVHLALASDGNLPVFAEDLEALNVGGNETKYGMGRIVRHAVGAKEISEKYLEERGYPAVTLRQSKDTAVYDADNTFSRQLASITRPKVNWTVIHLLAISYIAVIGPLHFRFRRKLDYRLSILVFLAVVAIFGTLFAVVGRRGYGESQTVNSVTLARVLGDGRYDTLQWVSAFATIGDIYSLTHDAPANLYSPLGLDSGANRIVNGKDGHIDLDIPLYSARTFVHAGVMKADDVSVAVDPGTTDPINARLKVGPNFPGDFKEARLFFGDQFYDLALRDGFLVTSGAAKPMNDYLGREKLMALANAGQYGDHSSDAHHNLVPLITARALNVPDRFMHTFEKPSGNHPKPWKLCVVSLSPTSFGMKGAGFNRELGWVVYLQEILPP